MSRQPIPEGADMSARSALAMVIVGEIITLGACLVAVVATIWGFVAGFTDLTANAMMGAPLAIMVGILTIVVGKQEHYKATHPGWWRG